MQNDGILESIACVKDLFLIAKMSGSLREDGHISLPDSSKLAIQASRVGMAMWKNLWENSLKDDLSKTEDNQKIDRGTRVVAK